MGWTFYLLALPAVVILGLGKGGFAGIGMLSLPLMALAVPPLQAASILLPILIVQDAISAWAYRHSWDRKNLVILLPSAGAGVLVAYLFAAEVSPRIIDVGVGVISALFGARQLKTGVGGFSGAPSQPSVLLGMICGAGAGFTSMLANAGAPLFQAYVVPQRLSRDIFVGTSVIVFTAINWMKVGPFLALGEITRENMIAAGTLLPVAVVSTLFGVYLVRRVSGQMFFQIIYLLMILVGVRLCVRGIVGV